MLCYKSEVRWFDPSWCHWIFIDIKSFRSHCGPGIDSASNRNEYQEHFLGVKWVRCVRLTTYHHPMSLSRNLGTLTSWNPLGHSGPLTGLLYLYLLQSYSLHFLQDSPLVQTYTSASEYKCVGNIPGNHFMKAFSALPAHSWFPVHHKSAVPWMLISVEGTGKNQLQAVQDSSVQPAGSIVGALYHKL